MAVPVIVIFAPTACGKTALTVDLFGSGSLFDFKRKAEIISCDSQAVYKKLDIGTAKPTQAERSLVPYHMVDFVEPDVQFGLGEFMEIADGLCEEIWARGNVPVLCGGTGFYIRNFLLGAPETPESNPQIRNQVKERLASCGKESLYAELKVIDPASAEKINPNDEYRICRALEVFYTSGKVLSSYKMPSELRTHYRLLTIILDRPKEELYERIDQRVDSMFDEGLEAEVDMLKKNGYGKDAPAMKAIGYSEFFIENIARDELILKIKNDSHHYAKKQYTFMKGIPGAITVGADDTEKIVSLIMEFIDTL